MQAARQCGQGVAAGLQCRLYVLLHDAQEYSASASQPVSALFHVVRSLSDATVGGMVVEVDSKEKKKRTSKRSAKNRCRIMLCIIFRSDNAKGKQLQPKAHLVYYQVHDLGFVPAQRGATPGLFCIARPLWRRLEVHFQGRHNLLRCSATWFAQVLTIR